MVKYAQDEEKGGKLRTGEDGREKEEMGEGWKRDGRGMGGRDREGSEGWDKGEKDERIRIRS